MKAFLVAFAGIVLAALATIAGVSLSRNAPAKEAVHEVRPIAGFHRLDIAGQAAVTLVQGSAEGVSIDAPASMRVRTDVRDGTLTIEVKDRSAAWQWLSGRDSRGVRITINLRDLDRVETAGAVTLTAERLKAGELHFDLAGASTVRIGELEADNLNLDGSGATSVTIGGKVARQNIHVSGAGSYDGGRLASEEAAVEVSGAGKAVVDARGKLKVDISGAGSVEYLSHPQIEQSISGIGKVSRRQGS
ncbi:MAG TPA: head GIN domain-containing protein [Casimicrobiaceae bacterium]|nr:head GIN domain-containing protein [Casimicrobiaceae bacterium]